MNVRFFEVFKIETMLSDDFSRILKDVWSNISIRRYVLLLELDKKVDSVLLTVYSTELHGDANVSIISAAA